MADRRETRKQNFNTENKVFQNKRYKGTVQDFSLLQQCRWGLCPSGMWCCTIG